MKSLLKSELDALLDAASAVPLDRLMMLVAFNHGLRVSEVISLTRANVVSGHLVVQRLKRSRKTTQRLLPNEKDALEALALRDGLFFPICRKTFARKMKAYGRKAGIPEFKLHPHVLKHTTGRLGYEGGMGIPELQSYMGHVNGGNTLIYLQADEDTASKAFAAAVGR